MLIDCQERVSNVFSLTFLKSFNKAAPLSDMVKLSFNEDTPLVVEYTMEGLGSLKFYLAPKINDE